MDSLVEYVGIGSEMIGLIALGGAVRARRKYKNESLFPAMSQRARNIAVQAGIGALLLTAGLYLRIGAGFASTRAPSACDDVMFAAAHPRLETVDLMQPGDVARRFLHDARELSASDDCNRRSWGEAYYGADKRVVDEFKARAGENGFMTRREREVVELDIVSATPQGAGKWAFEWVEHVRTPRGQALRSERYSGVVGVARRAAEGEALRITEFRWNALEQS
jgi:hypothetical protein